jgi:DeoR family transcriptional regulator, catabolite repression regulator
MAIGDRQLKILQAIQAGHTTGEAIVETLGSSMQMLSHYMNQMVEDGYIKAARLYDNELRDFVVVRAYLTSEGEAILAQIGPAAVPAATNLVKPPPAATPLDRPAGLDYGLVSESIQVIGSLISDLPSDWREMAEVYLDDLQNEINIAYRRRPIRIRAYFLALLRMMLPIVPKLAQGEAFLAQVRVLSGVLAIPVKLPDNQAVDPQNDDRPSIT